MHYSTVYPGIAESTLPTCPRS